MADYLGPIIGFASAWVFFELTELRRRWVHAKNVRIALIAELKSIERAISATVCVLSPAVGDYQTAVSEMRWGMSQPENLEFVGSLPPDLPQFLKKSDEEIVSYLKLLQTDLAKDIPALPLPIVNGILSAQAHGFSQIEIELLSAINRYCEVVRHHENSMREHIRLSFTVTDPENHASVRTNYNTTLRNAQSSLLSALRYVRKALKTIPSSPPPVTVLEHFYWGIRNRLKLWITRLRGWIK